MLDSEAQLAYVLGHEIAHVERRHTYNTIRNEILEEEFDKEKQVVIQELLMSADNLEDYVLKPQEQFLSFKLRDEHGEVMPVEYRGVIPGNFDQAVSVVAIGKYEGDHFEAQQLLVKCPSKYQAEADKAAKGKTS